MADTYLTLAQQLMGTPLPALDDFLRGGGSGGVGLPPLGLPALTQMQSQYGLPGLDALAPRALPSDPRKVLEQQVKFAEKLDRRFNPEKFAQADAQKAQQVAALREKQQAATTGGQFAANPAAMASVPAPFRAHVAEAAQQTGLDPALIAAVMGQESLGQATAVSPAGASGLMQLMPATARGLGVTDINDPRQNILAGARYLRQQMDAFGGNLDLALAAYNAGPGAVQQAGNAIPAFAETQRYVPAVRQRYEALRAQGVDPAGANAAVANSTGYAFPVQGYRGTISTHHGSVRGGSDIMADEGTPVVAMRGGTVLGAGTAATSGPGGNWLLIRGDDGNQYYYAHLRDAPLVRGGQVQTGTPLGFVGRTGNAATTPPHLHLGIGPTIQNGIGPLGGTGGNYDAVGLLMQVLAAAAAGQ